MIVYNMRYRGPYEYDKLVLNVLQFHNEMVDIEKEIKESGGDQLNASLRKLEQLIAEAQEVGEKILLRKELGKEI